MRRALVALALLLGVSRPVFVEAADESCSSKCCKLQKEKARALREHRINDALCMDGPGDEDACQLARMFAERYQQLADDYDEQCKPPPVRPAGNP